MHVLHDEHEFSGRFRIRADLVDPLLNSTEKRLAHASLLLARYGNEDQRQKTLPKVSQETLAKVTGRTAPATGQVPEFLSACDSRHFGL